VQVVFNGPSVEYLSFTSLPYLYLLVLQEVFPITVLNSRVFAHSGWPSKTDNWPLSHVSSLAGAAQVPT